MSIVQQIRTDNTPFDAELFFMTQRYLGAEPYVMDDIIVFRVVTGQRSECLNDWAEMSDPGGWARATYARIMWSAREPGQRIVMLG